MLTNHELLNLCERADYLVFNPFLGVVGFLTNGNMTLDDAFCQQMLPPADGETAVALLSMRHRLRTKVLTLIKPKYLHTYLTRRLARERKRKFKLLLEAE